jgi:predicted GNAT superfamily acetyltransferase
MRPTEESSGIEPLTAMSSPALQFEIRHCHRVEEFRECVELQRSVWNFDDRDLIPVRMFVVARKVEGQVIAAYAPDGAMAGFCLAIPALRGNFVYLHSHMLAVLPEHRRAGLGKRLKWEQRREALARGIKLIEWTFDPLEWQNAALNLNRLGAIARRYIHNLYGISSSPLHRGLPTDRLVAEWWLDSARVRAASNGQTGDQLGADARISFPLRHLSEGGVDVPATADVQQQLREKLEQAFAAQKGAMGFVSDTPGHGVYLIGPVDELTAREGEA